MLVCAEKSKAVRKICFGQKCDKQVEPWIVHSLVNHFGIHPAEFSELQQVATQFIDTFYSQQRETLAKINIVEENQDGLCSRDLSWSSLNFVNKLRRSQTGKC
ncbi:uncharacterized protein LOC132205852 [Neocloeon triangulifer]|uniref:uncharacterized protein LOC132205852 n=1 Tax=Neocloeon triangulifer TaxID=2078957 RepID=UPI00286EF2CA|nr:uncharacterized protein LOC132205852 [Neocloeon triangulifer]